jgi:hypothetical protein
LDHTLSIGVEIDRLAERTRFNLIEVYMQDEEVEDDKSFTSSAFLRANFRL